MEIRTYRARSMPQALDLIRRELGPAATVLHTRLVSGGLLRRMFIGSHYELAATTSSNSTPTLTPSGSRGFAPPANVTSTSPDFDGAVANADSSILVDLFDELLAADFDHNLAKALIEHLAADAEQFTDLAMARDALLRNIKPEIQTTGPIQLQKGACRVVAIVGPTGVGKTTTIAKLAANFRLCENKRVGLITVDTYRIAAVEQLRTYAEIIDLPIEVVSTPREMREAVERMRDYDLVLIDTAGRSPRDEVRLRELRAILAEATPDEVHLVLSAVSSARALVAAAEKFSTVGVTAMTVTKLDEATSLGHLYELACRSQLPFSYLTDGQNVPDDIAPADSRTLTRMLIELPAAV